MRERLSMSKSWWNKFLLRKKEQCTCQTLSKKLSEASTGQRLKIECIHGDEATCQRLREMGFCESAIVEKIADSGALICKVCDSKVAISKKLADNIIVHNVCHLKGHPMGGDNKKTLFLSQMAIGQRGTIEDFLVDSEDSERIQEMGITSGEEVEIVRYAPLGDPIEIKIRGYCLSLRRQEADQIKVSVHS